MIKGLTERLATGAALLALSAGAAQAGAERLYYERSLMLAADARCGLFAAPVRAALDVSTHQARGAALRAGTPEPALAATRTRAANRARSADCASQDLTTAAARVRDGFAGWLRTARMTFPGARQDWTADRTRYARDAWRLSQMGRFRSAPVTFGRVVSPGGEEGLAAAVSFPGGPRPYGARVVMRDPGRARQPWIVQASLAPLPPATARRAFWASSSELAPAALLPEGRAQGELWRFPDAAAEALADLDPRERFTVEFLFRDDSVMRVHFEAGDYAAARAFLALGDL
ncbi:MAG: hypothetical protein ACK4FB_03640 [Brevundimonas sp.]|uniref:hypothetical protein n=1 Tax=Brevundimonas sp. TaxID=1871086 RepID=UPI00391AB7E7